MSKHGGNDSSAQANWEYNATAHNQPRHRHTQQSESPTHAWVAPSGRSPDALSLLPRADGQLAHGIDVRPGSHLGQGAPWGPVVHDTEMHIRGQDPFNVRDANSGMSYLQREGIDHSSVYLSRQEHDVMMNTRMSTDSTTELCGGVLPSDHDSRLNPRMFPGGTNTSKAGSLSTSSSFVGNMDSFLETAQFPAHMTKTLSMLDLNSNSDRNSLALEPEDYRDEKKLLYREALMAGPMEVSDETSLKREHSHTRDYFVAMVVAIVAVLLVMWGIQFFPILVEGELLALPVAIMVPICLFFGTFAIQVTVFTAVSIFMGPVKFLKKNNTHYSFHKTPIPPGSKLPPVIIQMPVYKEDLHEVIIPTHTSVMKAVRRYQKAGGSVAMLVCDDGLQVISEEDASSRIAFYAKNQISFVARPKDNRRGLFKKASNMNYTLRIADIIKEKMKEQPGLTSQEALGQVWKEFNSEFVAGGDVTIPDEAIILLIDADTRVPEGCILDTMGEFITTPDLPYTQHFTQPFDEQKRNYWEQMICFFTEKIYFLGLMVPCAMGAYAPLVGHNAFLRWESLRKASYFCDEQKFRKYWGEQTVSEDFDLFMRLAARGMYGRYVVYTGPEFQEGVSLSYMDEVIKLRKFAYGSFEMVCHPLKDWFRKGPLTDLYKSFLFNRNIQWPDKFTLTFYLSTYYAMAAAFYLAFFEALCTFLIPAYFERYLVRGFDVVIANNFVFGVFNTLSSIGLTYRINAMNKQHRIPFYRIVWNEVRYAPFLGIFFSSILFQMTTASFCYLFSIKIVWGATVKEVSNPTSIQALKQTLEAYWKEYVFLGCLLAVYIGFIYYYNLHFLQWWAFASYLAMQLVGPIALNPHITSLTY